ncbi:hypothetical protein [Rhizobium leguminosarum]
MTISPVSWQEITNFFSGRSVWTLFGHLMSKKASLEPKFTPVSVPRAFIAINRRSRAISEVAFENTADQCQAACNSAGSPYCASVPLDKQQSDGLRKLRAKVLSNSKQIPPAELLTMFGLTKDECGRKETAFQSGTVENVGEAACELKSSGNIMGITAKLMVPGILSGEIKTTNDLITVEFPHAETRARLEFNDPDIQAEWGGDIKTVYSTPKAVGFAVGSESCVSVPLN